MNRRLMAFVAGAIGSAVLSGCTPPRFDDSFYRSPDSLRTAHPGDILRRTGPLKGAPGGATTYRVLYASTGLRGEPVAVSGVVVVPRGPSTSDRNVVAFAHGTLGVATHCAPSARPILYEQMRGLDEMLARDWVVAATDYAGLGTAGTHPYLVGVSEGRAVLDSVRAARHLVDAHAGGRFAVWGESQGGHAALFTGQLAATYARELELVGVATAAPATDLAGLMGGNVEREVGRILMAFSLWSWSRVYGASLSGIVADETRTVLDRTVDTCLDNFLGIYLAARDARPLAKRFLLREPQDIEPWKGLFFENSPGNAPAGAPLFIAQGTKDQIVHAEVTAAFVAGACRRGEKVRYVLLADGDHVTAGLRSSPQAVEWIAGRFAGALVPDDCAGK